MSDRIKCHSCGAESFNGNGTVLFCNTCHKKLLSLVTELESRLAELEDANRWIPVTERLPEDDGSLTPEYCAMHFNGDEWIIDACIFWCRVIFEDEIYYDTVNYSFKEDEWVVLDHENKLVEEATVTHWRPMPPPVKDDRQ